MTDSLAPDRPVSDNVSDSPNPANDAQLAVIGDALEEHGINQVIIRYEGSGDSGAVQDIDYTPENVLLPDWVDGMLRDLAEGYCPDSYANNEGGYGTLTIDVLDRVAEREHYGRYEETQDLDAQPAPLPRSLRRRLSRLGVRSISAHFDGYGDSGQIDQLDVEPESAVLDRSLADALENFLLNQLPGGWEINEGSTGVFTVDVPNGQVTLAASWRVAAETDVQLTRWSWRS
jgi:hypothetical protein